MMTYQGHLPERRSDIHFRPGGGGHLPTVSTPQNNNSLHVQIPGPHTMEGFNHQPFVNDHEAYMKLTATYGTSSPPHQGPATVGVAPAALGSPLNTSPANLQTVSTGSHQQPQQVGDTPSILRSVLTKPKPQQQTAAYSCPTPSTLTQGQLLPNKSPLTAIKSEPIAGQVEEEEEQFVSNAQNKPKYNFEAIKNYPPFRDAYNAAMARRRSKSFGQGARHRSSSESGPFTFAPSDRSHTGVNSIKCSRCNQVLTSKCLVNRCQSLSEQTKCKMCGKELTTKCLLANCQS